MFEQLTGELLDLRATVQGRPASRFAMLLSCCSTCCSCGARTGGDD